MTKKFTDVVALLNDIERNVDVVNLDYKGIRYWPYIRNKIFVSNQPVQTKAKNQSPRTLRNRLKETVPGAGWASAWLEERTRDKLKNDVVHPADIFYLTHSVCRSQLGARAIDRIFTPLIYWSRCLEGPHPTYLGHEYRPADEYRIPRSECTVYIQGRITLYRKLARIKMKISPPVLQEDLLNKIRNYVEDFGLNKRAIDTKVIYLDMEYVYMLSRYYEMLLIRVRPKIVMTVTYYSTVGMALMVAANRLNLPTFDLQHGLQGLGHSAYSNFSVIPVGGWNLLPKVFLNWRDLDANNINAWGGGEHRGVVLGIPWHEYIRTNDQGSTYSDYLDSLISSKGVERIVLVSMQPLRDNSNFIRQLIDAIGSSRLRNVYWLIRLHPGMLQEMPSYTELFQFHNVNVRLATEAPLSLILDHTAVHVTRTSSVAIDAAIMGVRSLVERGCDLFAEYETSGLVTHWGTRRTLSDDICECLAGEAKIDREGVGLQVGSARERYVALLKQHHIVSEQCCSKR